MTLPDSEEPVNRNTTEHIPQILTERSPRAFARRFRATYGADLVYLTTNSSFYCLDENQLYRRIEPYQLEDKLWAFTELCRLVGKDDKPVQIGANKRFVTDSISALRGLVPHAESDPCAIDDGATYDDRNEIVVENGIVNLATGEHRPADGIFASRRVRVAYDPEAQAPMTDEFVARLFGDDEEQIMTFWNYAGYCLTKRTDLQQLLMIVGDPGNGKSTLLEVTLGNLLGQDADGAMGLLPIDQLGEKHGPWHVRDKLVVVVGEARLSVRSNQQAILGTLLRSVGEDGLFIEGKFQEGGNQKKPIRWIIVTNRAPALHDPANAMDRRLIALHATAKKPAEPERGIKERLASELPGILNRAIAGYQLLLPSGLEQPTAGCAIKDQLREESSPTQATIAEFFADEMELGESDSRQLVDTKAVYARYKWFCEQRGYRYIEDYRSLSRELTSFCSKNGWAVERKRLDDKTWTKYIGIRLRSPALYVQVG